MNLNLSKQTLVNICVGVGVVAVSIWVDHLKMKTYSPSPRKTLLPKLSKEEIASLPYPVESLPGARDVETPYGSIRIHEWGPEDGRKVVLLHGISTPCVALGSLAIHLVERGCRVLTFDLFGRGYSDAPLDVPHDSRLYTTQLLLAFASSPISWTGSSTFDMVGYSFGGGLTANFARYFPDLIRSIILVAPGGVVRTSHINWRSKFLYSTGFFPETMLEYLVKRRLKPTWDANKSEQPGTARLSNGNTAEMAIGAEVRSHKAEERQSQSPVTNTDPNRYLLDLDPEALSDWQLENHAGFVQAFMSSIRNGPIHNQHADWRILGKHLTRKRQSTTVEGDFALKMGRPRALLVLGEQDRLVLKGEVAQDVKDVLGEENVEVALIEGGHDLPITRSKDLADAIVSFWNDNNFLQLS